MPRLKIAVLILFSASFLFPAVAKAIKPRPPIQLMFQENMLSETETEIILTAHANMAMTSASLSIILPSHVLVIGGETEWEGSLSLGGEQVIRVKIVKPETRQAVIEGRAIVALSNNTVFEQSNRLVLMPLSQRNNRSLSSSSENQGRKQRSIFDFKGE